MRVCGGGRDRESTGNFMVGGTPDTMCVKRFHRFEKLWRFPVGGEIKEPARWEKHSENQARQWPDTISQVTIRPTHRQQQQQHSPTPDNVEAFCYREYIILSWFFSLLAYIPKSTFPLSPCLTPTFFFFLEKIKRSEQATDMLPWFPIVLASPKLHCSQVKASRTNASDWRRSALCRFLMKYRQ